MSLIKGKTIVTDKARVLEGAFNSAAALEGSALDTFRRAARDLDDAAEEFDEVCVEAQVESDRLESLADQADSAAIQARAQAAKIRTLFAL